MEHLWMLFILIYALLKGTREGMKKAALKKSSSTEILFFYTLIGLLLTLPFSQNAFALAPFDKKYDVFFQDAPVWGHCGHNQKRRRSWAEKRSSEP